MLGWLFGKAAAGVIESTGTAVAKVYSTVKGNKAEIDAAAHDEQMAVLAQHSAEFVSRPTRTYLDSIIDFLARLPRVIITFWIFAIFTWPAISPDTFLRYILSLELVPEPLWQFAMIVVGLYFGGRVLSQDIRAPRLTEAQRDYALKTLEKQQEKIIEARTPLIVEVAPTRKPPPPPWAAEQILDKPKIPVFKPDPVKPPEIIKGRPVDIDKMILELLKREGGFSNDPSDAGGATNHGITIATLSAWREKECTVDDVKALTKDEACEIYRAEFYFLPGIDSLPTSLQGHVMDCCVNMGPRQGIKLLQRALNALGAGIKEDGIVGPLTRAGCNDYMARDIHNKLVDVRIKFYEDLAARKPQNKKFLNGWKKRAKSFAVV